jgi:hypothetical protein
MFGNKINTESMRISRIPKNSNFDGGITIGNTIFLSSKNFNNDSENSEIKKGSMGLLVHEATHVYQS